MKWFPVRYTLWGWWSWSSDVIITERWSGEMAAIRTPRMAGRVSYTPGRAKPPSTSFWAISRVDWGSLILFSQLLYLLWKICLFCTRVFSHIYVCVPCMCVSTEVRGSCQLKLKTVVSHRVGAGNQTQVLCKRTGPRRHFISKILLATIISPLKVALQRTNTSLGKLIPLEKEGPGERRSRWMVLEALRSIALWTRAKGRFPSSCWTLAVTGTLRVAVFGGEQRKLRTATTRRGRTRTPRPPHKEMWVLLQQV